MIKILTVKDYNNKGYTRYILDFNAYMNKKREFLPSLSTYLFDKKSGYIVTTDNGINKYFSKKQMALDYVVSLEESNNNG